MHRCYKKFCRKGRNRIRATKFKFYIRNFWPVDKGTSENTNHFSTSQNGAATVEIQTLSAFSFCFQQRDSIQGQQTRPNSIGHQICLLTQFRVVGRCEAVDTRWKMLVLFFVHMHSPGGSQSKSTSIKFLKDWDSFSVSTKLYLRCNNTRRSLQLCNVVFKKGEESDQKMKVCICDCA